MGKTQLRVLLVEDNPIDVILLREALSQDALAVFQLTIVENLGEALGKLAQQPFDAALLDLSLLSRQGLDTFDKLVQAAPELPVVVLSAQDNEEVAQQAVQGGAQDYLVKRPQDFESAGRAIRYAIERHKSQSSLRESEALLRQVLNSTPDALFAIDRNYRLLVNNPRYQQMLIASGGPDIKVGESVLAPEYAPEMLDFWRSAYDRALRGEEFRLETAWTDIHNQRQASETGFSPLRNTRGEITGVLVASHNITAQKQTEEKLREGEERFRALFENSHAIMLMVDPDSGHILDANPAAVSYYGYSRQQLVSMKIEEINLLSPQEIQAERQKAKKEARSHFIIPHRLASGEVRTVEAYAQPIIVRGQVLLYSIIFDITERKAAEQDAAYRQELLEKVIQLGKKIAGITDLDRCLEEIYRSARFGLGFDRVGLFLYDATRRRVYGVYGTSRSGEIDLPGFRDDVIDYWDGWEQALQHSTGISYIENFQQEFQLPENDAMYGVGQHATVAAWAGNEPVALLTTDNLLTGRRIKPADLEALQLFAGYVGLAIQNARLHTGLEAKVRERTAQVQDLYDNAPTGYHSLDAHGCYVQINQTELNWLGYSYAEMIGRPIIDVLSPESVATFELNFPGFMQRGWVRDLEMEFMRKDGTTFSTLVSATAIKDSAGNYLMSRSTVFDITERKQAEAALQASETNLRISRDRLSAANVALEKAARMKDEFLASMSHELRTPLTGILGLSEGLQGQVYGPLSERQNRMIANIESAGRHLLDLINDILDVSKLEAGMLELQVEFCPLKPICQTSLQLVKGMAQKKKQQVSFSMQPEDLVLQADARRFKQILVNLLSNAVKYTPEGGRLGLEVVGNESEHTLQISVWDRGIGIKTEDLDKLFQPFIQIDSSLSREQTGTGLGLTLVQHLVTLHGGSINVQSTFGEGSRFTIHMPWHSPQAPAPTSQPAGTAAMSHPSQEDTAPAPPRAALVLVVDDNETNRMVLTDFLSSREFRVAAAANAAEFFEQIAREIPDVVLMDIQMPGMDGLEAIRRIRAHPDARIAQVAIVALTALAMPGDREQCLAAGANEYLSKPVSLRNLASLIPTLI